VKITIIALSAAALIAAAPACLAQGVSGKTAGQQHKVSKKVHPGVSNSAPLRAMRAKGSAKQLGEPVALDRETEMSRQAGGGGGM
jgi:hypothetical protein